MFNTADLPHLIPLRRIAERFAVTQKTAIKLAKAGEIPAKRIGGRYYVSSVDARTFLGDTKAASSAR